MSPVCNNPTDNCAHMLTGQDILLTSLVHDATAMQYMVLSQPQSQLVSPVKFSLFGKEQTFDCVYRDSTVHSSAG